MCVRLTYIPVVPGMLKSMGSQRLGHDWATEQHSPLEYKK